jgi:hypothetical protein
MIGYLTYRSAGRAFGRDGLDVVMLSLILMALAITRCRNFRHVRGLSRGGEHIV